MFVPSTIRLSTGPAHLPSRPMLRVSLTRHELHLLTRALNAEADAAEREGKAHVADRLAWRIADLREAAR